MESCRKLWETRKLEGNLWGNNDNLVTPAPALVWRRTEARDVLPLVGSSFFLIFFIRGGAYLPYIYLTSFFYSCDFWSFFTLFFVDFPFFFSGVIFLGGLFCFPFCFVSFFVCVFYYFFSLLLLVLFFLFFFLI